MAWKEEVARRVGGRWARRSTTSSLRENGGRSMRGDGGTIIDKRRGGRSGEPSVEEQWFNWFKRWGWRQRRQEGGRWDRAVKPEERVKVIAGGRVCRGNRRVWGNNGDRWSFLNGRGGRDDWRDGDIIVTQVVQQGVKEALTKQLGEKEVAIVE